MATRFFSRDQFFAAMPQEIVLAADVYRRMLQNGFEEYALAEFDVFFVSDEQTKLERLGALLKEHYGFAAVRIRAAEAGGLELEGRTGKFPVNEENLLCWVMDMCIKGFEHDCRMDGYATSSPESEAAFQDEAPEKLAEFFDRGLKAYANRNYSECAVCFTAAIRIFPENPNAWYSRAIAKDDLLLNAKAREDYDEAIRLAPEFKEAYINRAVNKNEAGDYEGALADFNTAITLDALNPAVYFNRGNVRMQLGDAAGACADWTKARNLGADYADAPLKTYCGK